MKKLDNVTAKEIGIGILGFAAWLAVVVVLGSMNPKLTASDGFVEFCDGF